LRSTESVGVIFHQVVNLASYSGGPFAFGEHPLERIAAAVIDRRRFALTLSEFKDAAALFLDRECFIRPAA
jgi:predicted HAD superfamily phosphohydrolase